MPNGMPNVEQLSKSTMEPNVYIATYQNIGISMIENAKTVLPTLTLMLMLVNVSLVSLAKLTAIKYINVLILLPYILARLDAPYWVSSTMEMIVRLATYQNIGIK